MSEDYCTYEDVLGYLKGMDTDAWTEEEVIRLIDKYSERIDEISGSSFRENRSEDELHIAKPYSYRSNYSYSRTMAVHLQHGSVKEILSLKVFNGSDFEEYIGSRTEGRTGDYWVDYDVGIIFIMSSLYEDEVKVSYTYGETRVPTRVWELNIYYVVRHMLEQLSHTVSVPEGGQNPIENRISRAQKHIDDIETDITGWNIVDEGQSI